MAEHRRLNQESRNLTVAQTQRVIFDERMLQQIPRKTKDGGIHCGYEKRKPDPYGLMTENGADPD